MHRGTDFKIRKVKDGQARLNRKLGHESVPVDRKAKMRDSGLDPGSVNPST